MLRAAALRRGLSTSQSKRVVVVDGARIPFAMAGTKYKDQMAVDLMRYALRGLLTKTALPAREVDYVLWYRSTGTENVEHREGGGDARRVTPRYTGPYRLFGLRERERGDLPGGREDIVSDSA